MSADILVVDDDPRLRELVRFTLARAGFTVREAGDGRVAITEARRALPDLIVLDVLMPELDGLSVCRELRKDSKVPIIFLSTRGDAVDRVNGLEMGADDYLPKPFTPAELVSRVKAVLRRTTPGEDGRVGVGPVWVDTTTWRAGVGEAEVPLTATELRLLHALLARPGQVITRNAMVQAAYGGVHHVSPRTLDSHVRGVRQKLRDAGADGIETVHGVGWRWA